MQRRNDAKFILRVNCGLLAWLSNELIIRYLQGLNGILIN